MSAQKHRLPDFLIVGQPKSGTTALYEMLRQHPQVFMPEIKEPQYFAEELAVDPPPTNLPTTMDEYLALFGPAEAEQRIGEASIFYLWSRTAARNIAAVKPDARIIAILREPAAFLRALHLEYLKVNMEKEADLGRALALEDERRRGSHRAEGRFWRQLLLYSEHVEYAAQLRRYQQVFSADRILVLLHDDYRRDNRATLRKVMRFLEIDDTVPLTTVEVNPTTRRRNRANEALRAVSEGRGGGPAMLKAGVTAATTQRFRRAAQKAVRDRFVFVPPRPPEPDLMRELRLRYRPEVEALSECLGRDLVSHWGYDDLG